ncbi:MAG: hypothetical protein IJX26_01405 [Clostridia bacterium]|nr:hypothetical protein [Clostridia bacterium]
MVFVIVGICAFILVLLFIARKNINNRIKKQKTKELNNEFKKSKNEIINCEYCSSLISVDDIQCPHCGSIRKK